MYLATHISRRLANWESFQIETFTFLLCVPWPQNPGILEGRQKIVEAIAFVFEKRFLWGESEMELRIVGKHEILTSFSVSRGLTKNGWIWVDGFWEEKEIHMISREIPSEIQIQNNLEVGKVWPMIHYIIVLALNDKIWCNFEPK